MTNTRLYQFGTWAPVQEREEPTSDLARWISGHEVQLTPELSRALFQEFCLQERFRQTLVQQVHVQVGDLRALATTSLQSCEDPSLADYAQGYHQGLYKGYAESAQAIYDALSEAMDTIGGAK